MGAPLVVLDDTTPLDGPTIDVPARIGWILRMARLVAGEGCFDRLEDMAAATGTNVTALHRLESGRSRRGVLVNRYEQVLGLPNCSLRAPIDVLCRNYPDVVPTDREPGTPPGTVDGISALTDTLLDGRPTGGDWLAWARAISRPDCLGLPQHLAEDLFRRLASELGRAIGPAQSSRYEALAQLRASPYGHVLLDVARDLVADPHVEIMFSLVAGVAEVHTPEAEDWLVSLLSDSRFRVVMAGVQAVERLTRTSQDPQIWGRIAARVAQAYDVSSGDDTSWHWLSHLVRLIPGPDRRRVVGDWSPSRPLAPNVRRESWVRSPANKTWVACQQHARTVTDALGVPEQPMLARLIFDIAASPHETRGPMSFLLLAAVPSLGRLVQDQVAQIASSHPDPVVRDRSLRRIHGVRLGHVPDGTWGWLERDDFQYRDVGLMVTGMSGCALPAEPMHRLLAAGGPAARAAVFAAGMAGDPVLQRIRTDSGHSDELRGAARWWLREGGRVTDR